MVFGVNPRNLETVCNFSIFWVSLGFQIYYLFLHELVSIVLFFRVVLTNEGKVIKFLSMRSTNKYTRIDAKELNSMNRSKTI